MNNNYNSNYNIEEIINNNDKDNSNVTSFILLNVVLHHA